MTFDESQSKYAEIGPTSYNDAMNAGGYTPWAVDYFLDLNLDPCVRILDVCCATGLLSKALREKSPPGREYKHIDGLDASTVMLQGARETGNYEELFCCPIGGSSPPIPIADGKNCHV